MSIRKKNPLWIALLSIIATFSTKAQLNDYRDAKIITSAGDTLNGQVVYKSEFDDQKEIMFRDSQSERPVSVDDVSKLIFADGETYTLVRYTHNASALLKTFIEGDIFLYRKDRIYYLKKDSSIYELEDKTTTIVRDGKPERVRSLVYLTNLKLAFSDCGNLDYSSLKSSVVFRPLRTLVRKYATCKGLSITYVKQKPAVDLSFSGGVPFYDVKFSVDPNRQEDNTTGFIYTASLTRAIPISKKFRVRLDVSYLNTELKGNYTRVSPKSTPTNYLAQYVEYSSSMQSIRIPFGVQYDFLLEPFNFYAGFGTHVNLFSNDFDIKNYTVIDNFNIRPTYSEPLEKTYKLSGGSFPNGLWIVAGGSLTLTQRLKVNIEVRRVRSVYEISEIRRDIVFSSFNTTIVELIPSLGLKYKLQ